uniref:Uncharacterized protein n=1 Tax=Helianthus annuus TaxID=4232 RepID=A0A251V3D8_HELAN
MELSSLTTFRTAEFLSIMVVTCHEVIFGETQATSFLWVKCISKLQGMGRDRWKKNNL